jgi:hypothetical protein
MTAMSSFVVLIAFFLNFSFTETTRTNVLQRGKRCLSGLYAMILYLIVFVQR